MARTTIRSMMLLALSLISAALGASAPPSTVWTAIAADPKGDGREPVGLDAAQLSYQYDKPRDMLWFRLSLFGRPKTDAFKLDLAIDTGATDAHRAAWWGTNVEFRFDRLVTARVNRSHGTYHASAEIRHMAGPLSSTGVQHDDVGVRVTDDSVLIGLARPALLGPSMKMNLIVSIGSDAAWNDDIPNVRSATVDLMEPRPTRGLREIDVRRNNLRFAPGQPLLSDAAPPRITESGRGPRTLILIPGVYSGESVFEGFIARNESAYTFHVVTPPGLNGTPPRPLPPEASSAGEFTWTRRLERDLLDLIARKHLDKPIVVAHGFPGTLAAEELAVTHPQLLGGVVEIAGMPPQFFPAPTDPRRQATPAERVAVVNESWLPFWFKHVTPSTWETNNYPSEMFANDPDRGERTRQQVESAPLPVKIRYLIENMASDHRATLEGLGVPVLALIPGFSDRLLTNPLPGWFKTTFQDGWEPLRHIPRLELTTVSEARALMLDDQPTLVDDAIARFVARHASQASPRSDSASLIRDVQMFDGTRMIARGRALSRHVTDLPTVSYEISWLLPSDQSDRHVVADRRPAGPLGEPARAPTLLISETSVGRKPDRHRPRLAQTGNQRVSLIESRRRLPKEFACMPEDPLPILRRWTSRQAIGAIRSPPVS